MSRRRRWTLPFLLALAVGALVAVWFGAGDGQADVRLVFLGHSNVALSAHTSAIFGIVTNNWRDKSIFLVTNAGRRTVRTSSSVSFSFGDARTRFTFSSTPGLPARLKPGEALRIESPWIPFNDRWQAHILYSTRPMYDRLTARVWTSTNTFVRGVARKILAAPKYSAAQTGWITNPPPARSLPPASLTGDLERLMHVDFLNTQSGRGVQPHRDGTLFEGVPRGRYHITAPPPPVNYFE